MECAIDSMYLAVPGYVFRSAPVQRRMGVSVILSTLGIELILIAGMLYYLTFASWHDTVAMQNGRQIVVESNGPGTIGERRAFLYVNSIVHGQEVEYLWMS